MGSSQLRHPSTQGCNYFNLLNTPTSRASQGHRFASSSLLSLPTRAALPFPVLSCSLLLICRRDLGQLFNTVRKTILRLQAARILKLVHVNIAFMTVRVIKRNLVHFLEEF